MPVKHRVAVPSYDTGSENAGEIHNASTAVTDAAKAHLPVVFVPQLRVEWRIIVDASDRKEKIIAQAARSSPYGQQ